MAFEPIKRLIKNIRNLDPDRIINSILRDKEVQNFIIKLNTEGQLFKGIDSLGVKLSDIGGGYSNVTLKMHPEKKRDTVTLKDTGDFYKTFEVNVFSKGFEIEADTIKDEDDLEDRWGNNLKGLTSESRLLLVQKLRPLVVNEIKRQIKR